MRRTSQEQWDFLDRQRNSEVATLQEQGKALKHELGELKSQLKSISNKSLTKEQASKEAIARAEKHAREMSQLRQAHTHEVEVLQERLTAMSVEVERLRLTASFSPQHGGGSTGKFVRDTAHLSRSSPSSASASHNAAAASRRSGERGEDGVRDNGGWDVIDEPRPYAPMPLSSDVDSRDTGALGSATARRGGGKENFSLSAIKQVHFLPLLNCHNHKNG